MKNMLLICNQPQSRLNIEGSGFDQSWQEEFAWVLIDEHKDGQGVYRSLCRKHNQMDRNTLPSFSKGQHQQFKCRMDSIIAESHAATSRVTRGIRSALQEQVSM